jgi:hypothetical protein
MSVLNAYFTKLKYGKNFEYIFANEEVHGS